MADTVRDRLITRLKQRGVERAFRIAMTERTPTVLIFPADSGSAANWYARDMKFRKSMRGSLSGTLATMGPGIPYAVADKFCHPSAEGQHAVQ